MCLFQRFVKTIVEPLRNNLDDVASQGQMVIKSTPAGSNISEVEEDVRCLSDLRAELIQSVADRENALSNALLRMGEFRDTLILMINWLSNTEEVMVNQKPPSPEQSIIKAQLQEQEVRCRNSRNVLIICTLLHIITMYTRAGNLLQHLMVAIHVIDLRLCCR